MKSKSIYFSVFPHRGILLSSSISTHVDLGASEEDVGVAVIAGGVVIDVGPGGGLLLVNTQGHGAYLRPGDGGGGLKEELPALLDAGKDAVVPGDEGGALFGVGEGSGGLGPGEAQGLHRQLRDLQPVDGGVQGVEPPRRQQALLLGQGEVSAGPVVVHGLLLPVPRRQQDQLQRLPQGDGAVGGEVGGVRAVDHFFPVQLADVGVEPVRRADVPEGQGSRRRRDPQGDQQHQGQQAAQESFFHNASTSLVGRV